MNHQLQSHTEIYVRKLYVYRINDMTKHSTNVNISLFVVHESYTSPKRTSPITRRTIGTTTTTVATCTNHKTKHRCNYIRTLFLGRSQQYQQLDLNTPSKRYKFLGTWHFSEILRHHDVKTSDVPSASAHDTLQPGDC